MKFRDLGLDSELLKAIEKLGFEEGTEIQTAAIPHVLKGRDLSGLAQTGTGKTAAFLIPLMDRILKAKISTEGLTEIAKQEIEDRRFLDWKRLNFVLILVPTRELAEQVVENAIQLGEFSGLKAVSIYGGTGYEKQKEGMKNGVEFVIATPGRLIDLFKEHVIDLKQVRAVVFDEADRMFDMGFKDDMKYILQRIPRQRQFLVFSATLNFDVLNTAYQFGAEPIEIDLSRDKAKAENVKDEIFHVGQEDKPRVLYSLIKKANPKQVIIFSNFKHNVERIAHFLSLNGMPAMAISSLLTQSQRNRVIEQFKATNEKNIMVATDVAARGLDIKGVDLVINFELPNDAESYVHRIGRTGRAGETGIAYSLVSDRDVEALGRIEDFLKNKLLIGWIEESEIFKDLKPFPSEASSYSSDDESSPGGRRDRRPPRNEGRNEGRGGGHRGGRDGFRGRPSGRHNGDRPGGGNGHEQGTSERGVGERQSNDRRPQAARSQQRPHRDQQARDPQNRDQQGRDPQARPERFEKSDRPQHARANRSGSQGPQKSGPRPQRGELRSGDAHAKNQRRPFRPGKHAQAKQPAGIGQKIKGFFKKIFN